MTKPDRRSTLPSLRLTAFAAGLVFLAGCNPIGNGTGPVSMTLNGPDGTPDAATGTVYECIRAGVTAALTFDNGSVGDFTNRVVWTSSNPDVVRVSNLNTEPVPGVEGAFFGRGVLTPVAPGTARITAQFSDFTRFIDITVRPAPPMVMQQRDVGTGLIRDLAAADPLPPDGDLVSPRTRQRMGPRTTIDLTVTADLDGRPTRVDPVALWSFDAAPEGAAVANSAIASIDSEGVVSTVAANDRSLVARATFPPCGKSLATTITVSKIQQLTLVPEYGSQPLIAPNTERYFALADFGNGPEQDVSATITYTSSNTAVGAFLSAFIGIPNLLSSVAANAAPFTITATTPDQDAADEMVGPVVGTTTQTVVADTLVSIALEPQNPTAIAGSSIICPLRVVGTFASGATQDITRRATYSSGTLSVATVSSVPQTAGQVAVGSREPGTSVITATVANGTTPLTATTTYNLVAAPAAETCPQSFAPLPPFPVP